MANEFLLALASAHRRGVRTGITSVCSAHPEVIGAALALGRERGAHVLIEATCNQVNQDGGYTGMRPEDFRRFVLDIAGREDFDPDVLILGGDHLGPNPWTDLGAEEAMAKACAMVAAYVAAGFGKIHLDASMPCADDPVPLPDATVAGRSARLAAVAERHAGGEAPVYVIGTEVPVPGGATEALDGLVVTSPEAARETVRLHAEAFAREGIAGAFERVVGLVVQPGVEFGNANVVAYDRPAARTLIEGSTSLAMSFEAHSTDYQTLESLSALVDDGFGILKVGPGLTFALREALYGLDRIAELLFPDRPEGLRDTMERVMLERPGHWEKYCPGDAATRHWQRHFGYSDRVRYYWSDPAAERAVVDLLAAFGGTPIPEPLISQCLGALHADVVAGTLRPVAGELVRAAVRRVLVTYAAACDGQGGERPGGRRADSRGVR